MTGPGEIGAAGDEGDNGAGDLFGHKAGRGFHDGLERLRRGRVSETRRQKMLPPDASPVHHSAANKANCRLWG